MTKTTKPLHANVMTVFTRAHSQSLTNRLSGLPNRGTSQLITTSDGRPHGLDRDRSGAAYATVGKYETDLRNAAWSVILSPPGVFVGAAIGLVKSLLISRRT